uniref:AlNc14C82G5334 protein n=1 Tax=Albugo laibachii Nc14 TaxID=890382 RepID=F0WFE5_9STRA|nr:AlNc14C82G5334 [Albugo laibachii Nc14]|eukprot:CCA19927.1 AlNc14C82G5334 [Albugo laibachii Nc14]
MPTFGKDEPIVSYNFDACTKKLQASQNARKGSSGYLFELPASPKNTGGKSLKKKRTRLSLPTPLCIERYETSEEPKHLPSDEENEPETTTDANPFSSLLAASKVSVSTCDSTQENCEITIKENANSRPRRWDTITCEKRQTAKVSRPTKKYVICRS